MSSAPIFVKLGGSVLTDKNAPESLATPTLEHVARQLAEFRQLQPEQPLLIGHGGGSFGHYWAERYQTHAGIVDSASWWGVVQVADAMARLSRAVVATLLAAHVPAMSMQPSASAQAAAGRLQTLAWRPLADLLQAGVVPVVYGDVVLDAQQGCAIISTEGMFAALATNLHPQRIILVGEQAVYTADPRSAANAEPIPLITSANYAAVLATLGGSHGVDVTGGMRAKVESMWRLATAVPGLEIVICGPEALLPALQGLPLPLGTLVSP